MKNHYDAMIIGHISRDINTDLDGTLETIGGAVVYSAASAAVLSQIAVVTKTSLQEKDEMLSQLLVAPEDIFYRPSRQSTSIRNQYLTADHERRICHSVSIADPFTLADIPDLDCTVYHLAGLIYGDFGDGLIEQLAQRGKVAVDVQGFVRHAENGDMVFHDWADKRRYLPLITYFKTDSAEAELLTGLTDIREAARLLHRWGAREVMVTHHNEVVVCSDEGLFSHPIVSRNLSGRTGRGDTCFAAYYSYRQQHDMDASTLYAAALVSLKMETPGPFKGTFEDVADYIASFYPSTTPVRT